MAFFESEKTGDTPEEESGGSLLPRQIWIKSTYCRIKVSAINISSQENLPVVAHTTPPPQPFLFCPFLSSATIFVGSQASYRTTAIHRCWCIMQVTRVSSSWLSESPDSGSQKISFKSLFSSSSICNLDFSVSSINQLNPTGATWHLHIQLINKRKSTDVLADLQSCTKGTAILDIHPTFPIVHLSLDPPQPQFVPPPLWYRSIISVKRRSSVKLAECPFKM